MTSNLSIFVRCLSTAVLWYLPTKLGSGVEGINAPLKRTRRVIVAGVFRLMRALVKLGNPWHLNFLSLFEKMKYQMLRSDAQKRLRRALVGTDTTESAIIIFKRGINKVQRWLRVIFYVIYRKDHVTIANYVSLTLVKSWLNCKDWSILKFQSEKV